MVDATGTQTVYIPMAKDLKPPQPLDHFQVMRGVACLMVVLNHLTGLLIDGAPGGFDAWYVPLLMPTGFQWVWLFLALSGFLLTKAFASGRFTLDRAGITAFYLARARRLFPLLWAACILWSLLYFALHRFDAWPKLLPGWQWEHEISVAFALPWLPYSPGFNPISSVNSPVWSAIIEVHYCILMPLLLMRLNTPRRLGYIFGAWALAMIWLLQAVALRHRPEIFPVIYGGHLYNAGFFLAGMLLARRAPFTRIQRLPWSIVIAIAAVAMIAAQYVAFYNVNLALAVSPAFVLPAVCLLVARADDRYQVKLPDTFRRLASGGWSPVKWLERIGIMSYSVYLLHKPLGYILLQGASPTREPAELWEVGIRIAAVVILILVVVSGFYLHVENRFRRRRVAEG
jgi:peptidoglycan/LPS O-acetylase OafA/YrhL